MSGTHPYQLNQNSWEWKPSIKCFSRTPWASNDQRILGTTVQFVLFRFHFAEFWLLAHLSFKVSKFHVLISHNSFNVFGFYGYVSLLFLYLKLVNNFFVLFDFLENHISFFALNIPLFSILLISAFVFNSLFNFFWIVLLFFYGE